MYRSSNFFLAGTGAFVARCALFVTAGGLFVAGCGGRDGSSEGGSAKTSHFIRHMPLSYAHGFRIDYYDGYREVSVVNEMAGHADTLHFLLVDSGIAAPADRPGIPVITTPVRQFAVQSSVHVALADFAGVADRITGLGNFQYINSPTIRERIREDKVKEIGIDSRINNELVIAMHPGVLIAMTNPDAAFGQYKPLMDAGIPVMPDAEWLETTPLGRAEWVKLIGALVDKEDYVATKFDSVARAYQRLAAIGTAAGDKPTVIVNMPFKGTWYVPAGGNYQTQLLKDAGATYPWADTRGTGSLALNFEAVAPMALKADYWLNIGYVDSKSDILAKDSRYGTFHAFRTGALYNNNKRVNDIGSNDYWESGIVNPHLILADLIRILHPGLLPQDTLHYYKQLK
ncbi:MAG TPA: ABC transporter substrate-binding protein [Puia sp.]|nr:ABC transporter substrate-binding protein [Puia sp.]